MVRDFCEHQHGCMDGRNSALMPPDAAQCIGMRERWRTV